MNAIATVGVPLSPDADLFDRLVRQVWASHRLSNDGPLARRLEGEVARLLDVEAACLVSSGTVALQLALRLGGLPRGSEVITTPISFAASAAVIDWLGLVPVFADVDPDTLTLDPASVRAAISPRTSAVLSVHLYGTVADCDGLAEVARDHGLWLVHDGAHAFGVRVSGQGVGGFGDATAFSLHATKLLHTGEGGVVTTPADRTAELVRLRNFGLVDGRPTGAGTNAKVSEVVAALGLAVLPRVDAERAARARLRQAYDAVFGGLRGVRTPPVQPGVTPGELYYPVRLRPRRRRELQEALAELGISTRQYFPLLCGPGTAFPHGRIATASGGEPLAPDLAGEVLCLPFHSGVGADALAVVEQCAARILVG